MIALLLKAGRLTILLVTAGLVLLTGVLDLAVGQNVSLAALYIVPMMFGAIALRGVEIAGLAVICSSLRAVSELPGSPSESALRFLFTALAYLLSGLFVAELVRNHELVTQHLKTVRLEQSFRREAEEQLRFLAESSPAAILTMDERGVVLAANQAAHHLIMTPPDSLEGRLIGDYLPVLAEVLKTEVGRDGLRTAAQCQGRRDNGELFAAHAWFSSYASPEGNRLAAIIVDSSEELRAREEQGLREMLTGNKILAAAFSHEVRNFCLAMRMLCTSVQEKGAEESGADLQTLVDLVGGMEAVAATQLRSQVPEVVEEISLRDVLDNLRIVVDTQWSDAGGSVRWSVPEETPMVLAEPHGLLQVFMNLTQNSLRAVRDMPEKLLEISVTVRASAAQVRFRDSGPGVPAPKTLFQAFQSGAEGSGLGLYVSRSIVRSYGGDLQYEGSAVPGAVFVVDLQARSSLMTP